MSLNLRNEVVMELQLAEKPFRVHFPAGSTYQECFDALRQFADKILEMSKAYEEQQKDQVASPEPEIPLNPEVTA